MADLLQPKLWTAYSIVQHDPSSGLNLCLRFRILILQEPLHPFQRAIGPILYLLRDDFGVDQRCYGMSFDN